MSDLHVKSRFDHIVLCVNRHASRLNNNVPPPPLTLQAILGNTIPSAQRTVASENGYIVVPGSNLTPGNKNSILPRHTILCFPNSVTTL